MLQEEETSKGGAEGMRENCRIEGQSGEGDGIRYFRPF